MIDSMYTLASAGAENAPRLMESILGNIVLAPILIWFMRVQTALHTKMFDQTERSIAASTKTGEVLEQVRDVIAKCHDK